MWIFLGDTAPSKIFVGDTQISKVFVGDAKVRPTWPDKDYLCFTANNAGSTIKLRQYWSPTSVTLETSTDWSNWNTYTIWDTITLSNIWDKVYWRNTSTTDTWFSTYTSNRYYFEMTWSIAASWDITSLINKNLTLTLSDFCFVSLFTNCTSLTSSPSLPATTLAQSCYRTMFHQCTNLVTLPQLPATTLAQSCYYNMFSNCTKIKLATSQTWEYQTEYRIPTTWTWTTASAALTGMFTWTWWAFKSAPSINTTYYTSNTLV